MDGARATSTMPVNVNVILMSAGAAEPRSTARDKEMIQ